MTVWAIYIFILIFAVFLDYRLFNFSDSTEKSFKKALMSMSYWFALTIGTVIFIYFAYDRDLFGGYFSHDTSSATGAAITNFISGYLIEQALSADNIFVIAFILTYFKVPKKAQGGLLTIGIWTAIVLRGLLIFFGIWLIQEIEWLVYVLGAFLIYTGINILRSDTKEDMDPNKSFVIRQIKRLIPVTKRFYGTQFFIRRMGVFAITPMMIALIAIELTDIVFALDSIPAIFAITTDPFIVFSSNILAVANLRALYVILSKALEKLEYFHYALSVILVLVGIKLLLSHYVHIPEWVSILTVVLCLVGGVYFSIWKTKQKIKNS